MHELKFRIMCDASRVTAMLEPISAAKDRINLADHPLGIRLRALFAGDAKGAIALHESLQNGNMVLTAVPTAELEALCCEILDAMSEGADSGK